MGRYIFLLVISMTVVGVLSLTCIKCVKEDCKPVKDCKYGEGLDICACCPTCLKGPEEECRGIWNHAGNCGTGLVCSKENFPIQKNADGTSDQSPGVCKPAPLAVQTSQTAEVKSDKTEEVKTDKTEEVKTDKTEELKTDQTLKVKPPQPEEVKTKQPVEDKTT